MSNLRFASLIGADLESANARGVDFHGANLTNANLTRANLAGCDFGEANLSGVRISHDTNLRGCNLSGANIQGMTIQGPDGSISPANYQTLGAQGCTGIGLNIAAERAQEQGVTNAFVSTDTPSRAPESHQAFLASLSTSGISGGANVSQEQLANLSAPETPASSRDRERGACIV